MLTTTTNNTLLAEAGIDNPLLAEAGIDNTLLAQPGIDNPLLAEAGIDNPLLAEAGIDNPPLVLNPVSIPRAPALMVARYERLILAVFRFFSTTRVAHTLQPVISSFVCTKILHFRETNHICNMHAHIALLPKLYISDSSSPRLWSTHQPSSWFFQPNVLYAL